MTDSYTLVICEKPQAAMKIAYALAEIAPVKKNISGVPYWEVNRDEKTFIIASAVGHLFGLKQKDNQNKNKEEPIFDIEWKTNEGFSKKYVYVLKKLVTKAKDFIVACDYDVEGELIGFNVLRFICNTEKAKRMKFSTLTKHDLEDSYEKIMKNIDFGQAYAGETRHYLDWFYGINLSRALMNAIKKAGSFHIFSIGRVQGPALALIVNKEKKIQEFKAETYWNVSIIVESESREKCEVHYKKDIKDKKETEKFLELQGKTGNAKTEKNEQKLLPYPPFDLTSLQIESYKYTGLTPAQTLAIAQKLYLQGLISYPRTSSQKLPVSIGYKRILNKLSMLYPNFAKFIKRNKPIEGKKTDPAHPSIFPTGEEPEKLNVIEKKVYELIVKRFLACFAQEATIEQKKIRVNIGQYDFSNEGKQVKDKAWINIYPARIQEKILPDINGKVRCHEVKIEQKETKPPKRYSPATIINELEKRNLGTKATRAGIVETLYKRGYIFGKQIQATSLGMNVVLALEKNCSTILDEKLTRKFEKEMESIRKEKTKGKILKKEGKILDEAKKVIIKISKQFRKQEQKIGKILAEARIQAFKEERERNFLCLCPECKEGQLRILKSKRGKRFAACNKYPECKTTFPLPQFGLIKVKEKNNEIEKCECGLPKLLLLKKGKKPWTFCMNPRCYMKKSQKVKN